MVFFYVWCVCLNVNEKKSVLSNYFVLIFWYNECIDMFLDKFF